MNWTERFTVKPLSDRIRKMIDNNFIYHIQIGEQSAKYEYIRGQAFEFAEMIAYLTPESREQSLALTNLEQAVMWANAAIARNEEK